MEQLKSSEVHFLMNYFGVKESHLKEKETLLIFLKSKSNSMNEKAFEILIEKTKNTPIDKMRSMYEKANTYEKELIRKGRKVYRKG